MVWHMAWGAEHGAEAAPKGLGTEEASTSHQQFTQNNTWDPLPPVGTTSQHVNPTGLTMPHRPPVTLTKTAGDRDRRARTCRRRTPTLTPYLSA